MVFLRHASLLLVVQFSIAFCPAIAQDRPASDQPALRSIEALTQQGRLAEAKTAALNFIRENPSSPTGYNLLGVIEAQQHDFDDAISTLEKALQIAPHSAEPHNNLGNIYIAERKLDLAEGEFRSALRIEPANPDANYNLGALLLAKNDAAGSIPFFLRVHPQTAAARLNLIRAYLQVKRTTEALSAATELSREQANNLQLHVTLGILLASANQYRPAELELEKADALKPGTFDILLDLGQAYLRDGQYSKAELQLNQALKLNPNSPEALYFLAQTYQGESRSLDALELLTRAHRLAPENTDIILLMAQVAMSQRYFEDAIPLLEKGLEIAPQRTDLRSALGESYFKSDKVDKAIYEFEQVIKTVPSARAYSFLGLSHIYLGRFEDAKQDFQNGLKLEPHNNYCLFNLGYIAQRQGNSAAAEATFQSVLRADPDFPDALLELSNLYMQVKEFSKAEVLLTRYVRVSQSPASGYYKLAMAERALHQNDAAARDLAQFQLLSKTGPTNAYMYEHLFEYLDSRSKLTAPARNQLDLDDLIDENKKHPNQPEILYLLASAYLKNGRFEDAKSAIEQLDASAGDYRTLTGTGVLLARYRLYEPAIQHFEAALKISPGNDEIDFDLADAYFREGDYSQALDAAQQVSTKGQTDDAYLSLLGDIYAHLGQASRAEEIFRDAIGRNPDNDQDYLSLALIELREGSISEARKALLQGQARVPASGKILWGLGLVSALEGNSSVAAAQFERAVDLLPEWPGSYSTLGVFYFETGQIAKAREVLERFKNSNAGGLDINRIEQTLEQASQGPSAANQPLAMADRQRLLQLALTLADRTL
jgi:tetratricopeptide (TPR) repeat protein